MKQEIDGKAYNTGTAKGIGEKVRGRSVVARKRPSEHAADPQAQRKEESMIAGWHDLSNSERQEAIAPTAAVFGISPEEAVRLITPAIANARETALASTDDADIPEQMSVLARITEAVTGEHITAIKRGPAHRDVTLYPAGWDASDRGDYYFRRASGRLLRGDPERRLQSFTGYYFIVLGNPITVAGHLKQVGYPEASAGSSTACLVCDVTRTDPGEPCGSPEMTEEEDDLIAQCLEGY